MSVNTTIRNNKISKFFLTIFVLSLLTIFPLFALYMSSSGLKANKNLKSEMKAYKDSLRLPELKTFSFSNKTTDFLNQTYDKIIVLNFLDFGCKDCNNSLSEIKRIKSEFLKKTKRIKFVTIVLNPDSLKSFDDFVKIENIDTTSWNFIKIIDKFDISMFIKTGNFNYNNTILLSDRKGVIANYYNSSSREEINNLMRHATMLIPAKEDRRKIKYKRENELYN